MLANDGWIQCKMIRQVTQLLMKIWLQPYQLVCKDLGKSYYFIRNFEVANV